jgi:hypothetical protein
MRANVGNNEDSFTDDVVEPLRRAVARAPC